MNRDFSEDIAPPFAPILAAVYIILIGGAMAAKAPELFAYLLLFALPTFALLKPRVSINFILIISAISPLYMFFPAHIRHVYVDAYVQEILNLPLISLNLNGSMVLILLLSSLCAILALKNIRGLRVMATPFLPFLVTFFVVWFFRAPTQQGFRNMTTFLMPTIFAAAVFVAIRSYKDAQQIERSILMAAPLAVALALFCDFLGIRPAWQHPSPWSPVYRFVGSSIAPHMAMCCLPSLALLLGMVVAGQRNLWKYVALLTLVIALTVSRTAFVVAILMILTTVVFLRRNRFTAIFVGCTMILLIVLLSSQLFLNRSIELRGGEVVYSSGRLKMWEAYAKLAMKKPWLGYGIGQDVLFHEEYAHTDISVVHNDYLRLWFGSGIIGLSAFLFAFITYTRRVCPKGTTLFSQKTRWSALMILLGFALIAITDNPIALIHFTIPALAIITIAIRSRELDSAADACQKV